MLVYRGTALACVALSVLMGPLVAHGDDLAEVRAVFDQDIRLFNAQNVEAFSVSAHDDVVLFGILSPFATKGKEDLRQLIQQYFGDHIRVIFKPVNPECVVFGSSALAWGSYSITEYPKVGPRETIHGRYTFTYTKANGQWRLVAMHLSPLQGY